MCLLLETIKIKEKKLFNIEYHNIRMNNSRKILFDKEDSLDLDKIIKMPVNISGDLHRCRIIYDSEIIKIEFLRYYFRIINSLKIVHADDIDYSFKYENRTAIDELLKMKEACDDILIIKKGRIADTSFTNVIFFDNKKWITPSTPLLKGTKRAKLLELKIITEEEIFLKDLKRFKKARLINSMIDLEDMADIPIENIF